MVKMHALFRIQTYYVIICVATSGAMRFSCVGRAFWLADRYYDEELEAINDLDVSDKSPKERL